MREDPDVILLGELRDSETIRLALTAAETGHLVLATLHTRGASQAIERLIDTFPAQEKDPVRNQLAGSLRAVLAQRLLPDLQGGRVALYELLVNTQRQRTLSAKVKRGSCPGLFKPVSRRGCRTLTRAWQSDGRRGGCKPRRSVTLFEIAFEDNDGRSRIDAAFVECAETPVLKQAGTRFDGTQSFVVEFHGNAKATVDFIGKLTRAGGKRLFSAIHVQRQTDNHIVWLPLFEQTLNEVPVRCAVVRLKGRERASGAGDTLADGDANAFRAKVEGQKCAAHYACPATPGMVRISMPISFAASRQRSAIGF
ncbi:twitching motility protein [Enterobacter cloacae]|uniref:Twitching motility protein n=1 Tax=Enterobacter cloacae TaxID=550 RepID=A0A377LUS9_ENTCL|nr:twitching motility protein [Enterobacter cloacae]